VLDRRRRSGPRRARLPHAGPLRQAHVGSAQKCVDLANAVANNESGRAWTTLERPSRRVTCQQAIWTTTSRIWTSLILLRIRRLRIRVPPSALAGHL
jgi:hypothetical protein